MNASYTDTHSVWSVARPWTLCGMAKDNVLPSPMRVWYLAGTAKPFAPKLVRATAGVVAPVPPYSTATGVADQVPAVIVLTVLIDGPPV